MTTLRQRLSLAAAAIVAATAASPSCTCNSPSKAPVTAASAAGADALPKARLAGRFVASRGAGLHYRLSDGDPAAAAGARPPLAAATPLSRAETDAVIARLPALAGAEERDFALRPASQPPPRTGNVVTDTFPPAQAGPPPPHPDDAAAEKGPLAVIRHAPEGDVELAPHLSISFSKPMIAVTSQQGAVAASLPATITPQPPGKWRWVGTRTLLFEPEGGRFPMATEYTVTVPAGTKSATGEALAEAKTFTFKTPPAQVRVVWPPEREPQPLQPILFLGFDQRVSPDAVLGSVVLDAGGKKPLRLATADEIKADENVQALVDGAEPETWVALRPKGPLPTDTGVDVTVRKGTPSLEGPLRTTEDFDFSFRTYGPLEVVKTECGWSGPCRPGMPWVYELSNPIDVKTFDEAYLTVTPALKGQNVAVSGNHLSIYGAAKGRTTYKVKLSTKLKDEFGQNLVKEHTATFEVGPADRRLSGPSQLMIVADPAATPTFNVYSVNHESLKVKIQAVEPADWDRFRTYLEEYHRRDKTPSLPGRTVFDEVVKVKGEPDELTETRIDLTQALRGRPTGQLIVHVEQTIAVRDRWDLERVEAWVQVTKLGLDAFVDGDEMVAWANELGDGAPAAGVELELWPPAEKELKATSGADGLARLPLPVTAPQGSHMLLARRGDDLAILTAGDVSYYGSHGSWVRRPAVDTLRWHVFDDRTMYRPSEEVHVKGWVRRISTGKRAELTLPGVTEVVWTAYDEMDRELAKGTTPLGAAGGFDLAFKLPGTPNLGSARVELLAEGGPYVTDRDMVHYFEIQEFRRPEFEVSASVGEGPFLVGDHAVVTVNASYYAGGGLPGADTHWTVTASPAWFTPPNRGEFSFGQWVAWWGPGSRRSGRRRGRPAPRRAAVTAQDAQPTSFDARTSPLGAHDLRIDFDSMDEPRAMSVSAQASVEDVNRQEWAASASLVVHPASEYVGLKIERPFVQAKQPIEVDTIVCDLDGDLVAGREVAMRAVRLHGKWKGDEWIEEEKDEQTCKVTTTTADGGVRCSFQPAEGGRWRITATITDPKGRTNKSDLTVWVAGGKVIPSREVEQQVVTLVPDKKEYQPGDTAEILVVAPFAPAHGLVSVRHGGILRAERITMTETTLTIRVPILEEHLPGVTVEVDLVGKALRANAGGEPDDKLPPRSAYASGSLGLPVPPLQRKLAVTAKPRQTGLEPGGETVLDVEVKTAAGGPAAGAEVAVVVVDESILALSGRKLVDPIDSFYLDPGPNTDEHHSRAMLVLANVLDLQLGQSGTGPGGGGTGQGTIGTGRYGTIGHGSGTGTGYGVGSGRGGMRGRAADAAPPPSPARDMPAAKAEEKMKANGDGDDPNAPIEVRSDFNPLATWSPVVRTGADGRAEVKVKVPDNLTRYRVMAVAVHDATRFGAGESTVTARLPLMVRPQAPRFLNFGDKFELAVVLQNQTDEPMGVHVALRAANLTLEGDGLGRRVEVPANDRVEVRFAAAARRAGTARFQVGAVGGGRWTDAAEVTLPVWTPATTEAFATYGVLDGDATVQPIVAPTDVVREFGGLEISTSSTAVAALTDAVLYLVSYRYECSEQLSSRVLAVAGLKDVLTAFRADGLPSPEEMRKAVARDLDRLKGRQDHDGGFLMWDDSRESWPWGSLHVTHAIVRAKQKGFAIDAEMLERALAYVAEIESHIPSWWGPRARWAHVAYSLYVRKLAGTGDPAKARRLIDEAKLVHLGMDDVGFLLFALAGERGYEKDVAELHRHVLNKVTETAGAAHFVTEYDRDEGYLVLASDRRADGILLEAMIASDPKSDLIPKVVRGLLGHRRAGHWGNTQENSFVLMALDKYFNTYEKVTPNFVANVWLGDRFAGSHPFRGRTTESHEIQVPMAAVMDAGKADLTIGRAGAGRLYYRIGMRYAPASLQLAPAEYGFVVERVYEAVDDAADVTRDADGVWHVKAGARVRVRLTMVAPARREFVALVDPIPAGLEPMNAALAVTGDIPEDPKSAEEEHGPYWWWSWPWYEHQNVRDERVEAFTTQLWEGVHTYTYVARATSFGRFVVPPAKAEEMYSPETFGRSGTDRLVVE